MDLNWRRSRKNTILATASLILLCLALFGRNLDQSWSLLYSLQFFCNLYSFFDEFESFWDTMFVNLVFQTVPRRYTCEYHLLVSPFFVCYYEVNSNIFEIIFFMISRAHMKVSESYWKSYLRNTNFFQSNILDICISENLFNIVSSGLMSGFSVESLWAILFSSLLF